MQDDKGNSFKISSGSGAVEIVATGKLTLKGATVEISASGTVDIKGGPKMSLNAGTIMIN